MSNCHSGNKSCKHIKGIQCNVKNCYYNDCQEYCTADHIAVGPCDACNKDSTVCTTFKPKED